MNCISVRVIINSDEMEHVTSVTRVGMLFKISFEFTHLKN